MFQIRSKEENRREIMSKSKICKYNPSSRHHVLKSDLKASKSYGKFAYCTVQANRIKKMTNLRVLKEKSRKRFLKSKLLLIELAIFAVTEAGK